MDDHNLLTSILKVNQPTQTIVVYHDYINRTLKVTSLEIRSKSENDN